MRPATLHDLAQLLAWTLVALAVIGFEHRLRRLEQRLDIRRAADPDVVAAGDGVLILRDPVAGSRTPNPVRRPLLAPTRLVLVLTLLLAVVGAVLILRGAA